MLNCKNSTLQPPSPPSFLTQPTSPVSPFIPAILLHPLQPGSQISQLQPDIEDIGPDIEEETVVPTTSYQVSIFLYTLECSQTKFFLEIETFGGAKGQLIVF